MVRACFPAPVAFGRRGFFVGIGIARPMSQDDEPGRSTWGQLRHRPVWIVSAETTSRPRIPCPVGAVVLASVLRVEREWPCRWPAGHQGLSGLVSWPDQAVRGWVG